MKGYVSIPKAILRKVGRAIADYEMIREGDRVMLGLSGGKDSLTLLHTLIHLQRHAPIKFDLTVMTVDPQIDGFDPSPLKQYVESLNLKYHFCSQPIMSLAEEKMKGDSFCSWCARMKRGVMYTTAREHGYNVLALAQHLDDLAESFMMSAFYEGRLNTMKAQYTNNDGDIRIIRPFVYVRERQIIEFNSNASLPIIAENCPSCYTMPTKREHMKQLLAAEENENNGIFPALLSAMRPLMDKEYKWR